MDNLNKSKENIFNTTKEQLTANILDLNKKIKDCNEQKLYSFFTYNSFIYCLFYDLQELNDFIAYLFVEKGDDSVNDVLKNLTNILANFRK